MKSTFFFVLLASLFLFITLQAHDVKPKAPTTSTSAIVQYEVFLWTKGAAIKINGAPIRKNLIFINPSDIKFSAPNQWINTLKVGSSNEGFIFINDCSSGPCKTLKRLVSVSKKKLETEDLRKQIKSDAVSTPAVRTN